MAVYTIISDEDLTGFLNAYNIGTLLSYKGIAEGVENSNYLLHTTAGFYILTLYEKRVNSDDLPFFMQLMDHLFLDGIDCPQPVHRNDGKVLGRLAGRPAAIVTFLDGVATSNPNEQHCALLGEGLAKMHVAGLKFKGTRPNALSIDGWRSIHKETGSAADQIEPGLQALIGDELDYLEQNWPDNLPVGIIHADLFPDNVFFLQDGLAGFIDFYFSCTDLLAYDVAICLNAWCFDKDGGYNSKKAQNLLESYQRIRKFNRQENQIFSTLVRGASIRFLVTRVYDWINTPKTAVVTPKKPDEYIKKLKFHQSTTDFCIYGVEVS